MEIFKLIITEILIKILGLLEISKSILVKTIDILEYSIVKIAPKIKY